MKKENGALLFFRTFFAVLFSILLVILLLVVPLYNTVSAVTQPKRIAAMLGDVVRAIDLTEMIELPETIEIGGKTLDAEAVKTLLRSDVARNILSECTEQMMLVYMSDDPTAVFSEENVQGILTEHADDLTTLLNEQIPEAEKLPTEKLEQELSVGLTQYTQELMEQLPPKEELQQLTSGDLKDKVESTVGDKVEGDAVDDALDQAADALEGTLENTQDALGETVNSANEGLAIVQQILSPTVAYALYGSIAVLALLILLCRYKNLNGLVWLGVDGLLAGIPLMGVCAALTDGAMLLSLLPETELPQSVVASIAKVVLGEVQVGAVILLAAGVVLIAGGIVYKVLRKKTQKNENAVPLSAMM